MATYKKSELLAGEHIYTTAVKHCQPVGGAARRCAPSLNGQNYAGPRAGLVLYYLPALLGALAVGGLNAFSNCLWSLHVHTS